MEQLAKTALDAAGAGNYRLAIAALLVCSVAGVRWIAPKIHGKIGAILNGNRGGSILVLLGGITGAIGSSLIAKQGITLSVLVSGITAGVTASGGWNVVWDLLAPSDKAPAPTVKP